jgi:polyferredoxin
MDRMGYKRGLVRYTTENAMEGRPSRILRPRLVGYCVAVMLMAGLFTTVLLGRITVGIDAIRERGQLYREMPDGAIENVYTLKLRNMGEQAGTFRLSVDGAEGLRIVGDENVTLNTGEVLALPVAVHADRDALAPGGVDIRFLMQSIADPELRAEAQSRFLAPAG